VCVGSRCGRWFGCVGLGALVWVGMLVWVRGCD